jgi:hypothetical protein
MLTRFPCQIMLMPFNSNTTGIKSGAEPACPSGKPAFDKGSSIALWTSQHRTKNVKTCYLTTLKNTNPTKTSKKYREPRCSGRVSSSGSSSGTSYRLRQGLFCGVPVARSLVFCVVFCRSLFVLLSNVLSVLRITDSDYAFGIFKLN